LKVLLLSAYAANSHVHWQQSLEAMCPQWHWQVLSLPPRHFSWRVRGNPLYWSIAEREVLARSYDLLIATSMVDLATLRGLVPNLASVPSVLYFHENQFAYPQDRAQHNLLEAQMVSLYSSLAADRVVFNSHYNRSSFMGGCESLLRRLPDRVPGGIVESIQAKARVLPVPLIPQAPHEDEPAPLWAGAAGAYPARPLRLLWVGRFEYDKGGEGLHRVLIELEKTGLDYELAVIGQQFRNSPDVFPKIEQNFASRLVQFGYLESAADYRQYLADADIVLSTAVHEFQGLAVLEAVESGCLPVVPGRLVYPEIFSAHYIYESHVDDSAREARGAAKLITGLASQLASGLNPSPDISGFAMHVLAPEYLSLFMTVAGCVETTS
jgi:glycosyltransferase involved in cell wall biosynthesis